MKMLKSEIKILDDNGFTKMYICSEAREVFDVSGAGDTVIAAFVAAHSSGFSLKNSARIANAAAGIVVGKLGTASITRKELNGVL